MEHQALIIEQTFPVPPAMIWKAITDKEAMQHWYFDLTAFKPEKGFTFQFSGGSPEKQYLHVCKITEIIPEKKLTYSWRYEGYEGMSLVSFELFPDGDKTILKLSHTGLETFPKLPDFARASFAAGWKEIIGVSLKHYLEGNQGSHNP